MNDLERDALRVSAVLDDDAGSTLEERFAAQNRVHLGLSAGGAAPIEHAGVDIRARVMARVAASQAASAPRRTWPVAAAASLTLMAGIGWVVVRSNQLPAPPTPETTKVAASSTESRAAAILNPFKNSDSQVRASLDATFVQQAKLIQQDTRQGMEMVLSRLPLGGAVK